MCVSCVLMTYGSQVLPSPESSPVPIRKSKCVCMCVSVCMYLCKCVCVGMTMCVYMSARVYECACEYGCYVCVRVCVSGYAWVCM